MKVLLADLGSEEFATREAAEKELAKFADAVSGELREALETLLSVSSAASYALAASVIAASASPPTRSELVLRCQRAGRLSDALDSRR